MKTFNKEDLITWANREKAVIGNRYYFGDSIDSIKSRIETGDKYRLDSINNNTFNCTFKDDCGNYYACILPTNVVIEIETEKKYRPCKSIKEFYRVVMNDLSPLNMVESDFIYELIDRIIHFRSRNTGTEYTTAIRSISKDTNECIKILITRRSYLSFEQIFANYEIMNADGEWQPFGVLDSAWRYNNYE